MLSRIAFFLKDFFPYLIGIFAFFIIFIVFTFWLVKSTFVLKTKKIILTFAFLILSSVFIFGIFEAYFRYIYDESDGLGFLQVNDRWKERHVVYNNYFKRDRNFEVEKEEGVTRIGIMGDSIAFGQGIKDVNNRFSNLLENKLNESNKKVEVYNLGVPGLDTHEEIEFYNDVSHLNFDIIVLEYYPNDIQPADKSEPAEIISQNAYPNELVKWIIQKSTFLDFVYWRLSSKYSSTFNKLGSHYIEMYKTEEVLNSHKKELSEFIAQLQSENKEIVVIIFPFTELISPYYPADFIHNEMTTFFESRNLEVVDLIDDLKNENWQTLISSKFDTHPNEKVHKLAVDKLYEIISPKLN